MDASDPVLWGPGLSEHSVKLGGVVVQIISLDRAKLSTARVEKRSGARIRPDYADLPRIVKRSSPAERHPKRSRQWWTTTSQNRATTWAAYERSQSSQAPRRCADDVALASRSKAHTSVLHVCSRSALSMRAGRRLWVAVWIVGTKPSHCDSTCVCAILPSRAAACARSADPVCCAPSRPRSCR